MKYILNSAVITTPGTYTYRLITVEEAKEWLERGGWISTIGYRETAEAMSKLFGICVTCNRMPIQMKNGDEALVFRLTCRLNDPALKGKKGLDYILKNIETGILRKEEAEVGSSE